MRFRQRNRRLLDAASILCAAVTLTAAGCGKPYLFVDDAVRMHGYPTELYACAERDNNWAPDAHLDGVEISFIIEGEEVGRATTEDDGCASCETLPPVGASHYEVRAVIDSQNLSAKGRIFQWPNDRTIIAVDIDETLGWTSRYEMVFGDPDKASEPMKGASAAINRLSQRYNVFYLTARPWILYQTTLDWLHRHKFPPGPVVTALRLRESVYDEGGYKSRFLTKVCEQYDQLLIGIGNATTDSEAYGSAGLITIVIDRRDDHLFRPHCIVLRDWPMIERFLEANSEILEDPHRLQRVIANDEMLLRPLVDWEPLEDLKRLPVELE